MTACPTCHGKGWIRLTTGWPLECGECTPTRLVKGRVTLDKAKVAAIERARQHGTSVAPMRVDAHGTTHHYLIEAESE